MVGDTEGEGSGEGSWNVLKRLGFLQDESPCPVESLLCYLGAEILVDKLILGVSILKKRVQICGRCILEFLYVSPSPKFSHFVKYARQGKSILKKQVKTVINS